jgi:four helix bundle protein
MAEGYGMGRLGKSDLLGRAERFCHRVLDVAEELERQRRYPRILDQIVGSGTSVGANLFEADEAVSRAEFRKFVEIAQRELSETRFWLRLIAQREWIPADRLASLLGECDELRRVLGTILHRTRPGDGPAR